MTADGTNSCKISRRAGARTHIAGHDYSQLHVTLRSHRHSDDTDFDARSCMAVVLPFVTVPSVRCGGPFYCVDRKVAPVQFVPLLSLGCCVEMRSCAVDRAASEVQYYPSEQRELVGGALLRCMQLSWDMFGPSAMRVEGAELHLTRLKVKQLQEELAARDATRSGRKRALQLRLRALIITAAAAAEE